MGDLFDESDYQAGFVDEDLEPEDRGLAAGSDDGLNEDSEYDDLNDDLDGRRDERPDDGRPDEGQQDDERHDDGGQTMDDYGPLGQARSRNDTETYESLISAAVALETKVAEEERRIADEDKQWEGLANEVYTISSALRALVMGEGGEFSAVLDDEVEKQVKKFKDLVCGTNRPEWRRDVDLLVLDPHQDLVRTILRPLWILAGSIEEIPILEHLLLIFARISEMPGERWRDRWAAVQRCVDALREARKLRQSAARLRRREERKKGRVWEALGQGMSEAQAAIARDNAIKAFRGRRSGEEAHCLLCLSNLKIALVEDERVWAALGLLTFTIRGYMKLDGLKPTHYKLKDRLIRRKEELTGLEYAPVTSEDIELHLCPVSSLGPSSETGGDGMDSGEKRSAETDSGELEGGISVAERLRVIESLLETLAKRQKKRKMALQSLCICIRRFILNILRIRPIGGNPWAAEGEDVQFRLLTFLVQNGLTGFFEEDWRLLTSSGGWNRGQRASERQDNMGLTVGSDTDILWRTLEFFYQFISPLSAQWLGRMYGERQFLSVLPNALETCGSVPADHISALLGTHAALDPLSVAMARSNSFRPKLRPKVYPLGYAAGDRKRYQKGADVNFKIELENIQPGELPVLAFELLEEPFDPDFTTLGRPKGPRSHSNPRRAEVIERILDYLVSFKSIAFPKCLLGWINDCLVEDFGGNLAVSTYNRVLNVICWVLAFTRHAMMRFCQLESQFGGEHATPEQVRSLEMKLMQIIVDVRTALISQGFAFVVGRLKKEMRSKQAERSATLRRVALRLILEQERWGLLLTGMTKKPVLAMIGKGTFQELMKKGIPTTLTKLLRDHTSNRAERYLLHTILLTTDCLLKASGKVPTIKKTGWGRRRVVNRSFDAAVDGEEALNSFIHCIKEPKIFAKLILVARDGCRNLVPPTVAQATANLLTCLERDSWLSLLFGWNLLFVGVYHEILVSKTTPDLEGVRKMILSSIGALAELHRTNRFVLIEGLFLPVLWSQQSDHDGMMTNYTRTASRFGSLSSEGPKERAPDDYREYMSRTPWRTSELETLIVVYEQNRSLSAKDLLRSLRQKIDNRPPEDINAKVVQYKILDPWFVGSKTTSQISSALQQIQTVIAKHLTLFAAAQRLSAAADTTLLQILQGTGELRFSRPPDPQDLSDCGLALENGLVSALPPPTLAPDRMMEVAPVYIYRENLSHDAMEDDRGWNYTAEQDGKRGDGTRRDGTEELKKMRLAMTQCGEVLKIASERIEGSRLEGMMSVLIYILSGFIKGQDSKQSSDGTCVVLSSLLSAVTAHSDRRKEDIYNTVNSTVTDSGLQERAAEDVLQPIFDWRALAPPLHRQALNLLLLLFGVKPSRPAFSSTIALHTLDIAKEALLESLERDSAALSKSVESFIKSSTSQPSATAQTAELDDTLDAFVVTKLMDRIILFKRFFKHTALLDETLVCFHRVLSAIDQWAASAVPCLVLLGDTAEEEERADATEAQPDPWIANLQLKALLEGSLPNLDHWHLNGTFDDPMGGGEDLAADVGMETAGRETAGQETAGELKRKRRGLELNAEGEYSMSLGILKDSLEFQACLFTVGGRPDSPVKPSRWEFDHSKKRVAKLSLAARVLLLGPLKFPKASKEALKSAPSEAAIWTALLELLKVNEEKPREKGEKSGDSKPGDRETDKETREVHPSEVLDADLFDAPRDDAEESVFIESSFEPRRPEKRGFERFKERAMKSLEEMSLEAGARFEKKMREEIGDEDEDELYDSLFAGA